MHKTNKIMVGLDMSEMDSKLISYAKYLNLILRPDSLNFVHIQKDVNVPQELLEQYPELKAQTDSQYVDEMIHETEGFNIVGTEVNYNTFDGSPFKEIMNICHDTGVDLLLMGRKSEPGKSGIVPQKLARKSSSDILLLPEKAKQEINTIVVAVDFSDYSKLALEAAVEIASKNNARVICQHIYEVPMGYSKIGKTFEEFAEIMKGYAVKDYEKFIQTCDLDGVNVEVVYTLNNHSKLSTKIEELAQKESADLIIIGARGRTDIAAIFLGSVTEQLIAKNNTIPLLIVKKKDKTFGFWDYFKDKN